MHEAQSVLCSDLNSALLRDAKRTLAALLDEDFRKKYPQLQQRAKEFGKALGALEKTARECGKRSAKAIDQHQQLRLEIFEGHRVLRDIVYP